MFCIVLRAVWEFGVEMGHRWHPIALGFRETALQLGHPALTFTVLWIHKQNLNSSKLSYFNKRNGRVSGKTQTRAGGLNMYKSSWGIFVLAEGRAGRAELCWWQFLRLVGALPVHPHSFLNSPVTRAPHITGEGKLHRDKSSITNRSLPQS